MDTGSTQEEAGISPAEASRKRIAEAGGRWYRVLNVSICATLEDIKKAHRKLVLLHHPDKGGDADTFKLVHTAYSEAQKKCMKNKVRMGLSSSTTPKKAKGKGKAHPKRSEKTEEEKLLAAEAKAEAKAEAEEKAAAARADAEAKALAREQERAAAKAEAEAQATAQAKAKAEARGTREVERAKKAAERAEALAKKEAEKLAGKGRKRARPKAVPLTASKQKLANALERLETLDPSKKTMPEDVPWVTPEQVAVWLVAGTCVPIDAREDHELTEGPPLYNAFPLKYSQIADAEVLQEVAPNQISRLLALQAKGKQLVVCSSKGTSFEKCYFVASCLLDLFGFNPDLVWRVQGGYDAWSSFMEPDSGATQRKAEDGEDGANSAALLRAEVILTGARDAQRKADSLMTSAKTKLDAHDNLLSQHVQVLEKGVWKSEEDRMGHVTSLFLVLKPLDWEESLMDLLASAASTRPGERGFMHNMAFTEMDKRFTETGDKLRAAFQVAADVAEEKDKILQEAEAAVSAASG